MEWPSEPWSVFVYERLNSRGIIAIDQAAKGGKEVVSFPMTPKGLAVAHRIVACVNALQGVTEIELAEELVDAAKNLAKTPESRRALRRLKIAALALGGRGGGTPSEHN